MFRHGFLILLLCIPSLGTKGETTAHQSTTTFQTIFWLSLWAYSYAEVSNAQEFLGDKRHKLGLTTQDQFL